MKRLAAILTPLFIFMFMDTAAAKSAPSLSNAGQNFLILYILLRLGLVGVVLLFMFAFKKKR